MSGNNLFEILYGVAFTNEWLGYVLRYPLQTQLVLTVGVVFLFMFKRQQLKRRQAGRDIVYSFQKIEVRIDTLSESPIVLVREGRKSFHALAVGFDCQINDLEVHEAITETLTGTTSGGMTLDGKYVLPQTITVTRPTGTYFTRKVGKRARISFVTLDGENSSRRHSGVNLYSHAQEKKFDDLWQQLRKDLESVNRRFLPSA